MSLRDKLLALLILAIGLLVSYYILWPVVGFILKWVFLLAFTVVWLIGLAYLVINQWVKWDLAKHKRNAS